MVVGIEVPEDIHQLPNKVSSDLRPKNDVQTTYTKHKHKGKTRLKVLRALTNISFGHSREDVTQVYKQYIRHILSCAHPFWEPSTENTLIESLQTTQNFVIRIDTGCTSSTPIHQLHHETRVLPTRQHMRMRRTHIYTSTEHHNHPLHHLRSAPVRRP